jgi:hypothetical protein
MSASGGPKQTLAPQFAALHSAPPSGTVYVQIGRRGKLNETARVRRARWRHRGRPGVNCARGRKGPDAAYRRSDVLRRGRWAGAKLYGSL